MEKLFCFTSGGHSSPVSYVLLPLFLINVSFSTSTPITVSPTPRRTKCPACRALFPRTERSSSRSRCLLMTAARRGWASASKETSPGRPGRTWGSSSNPLSTEALRTRWPNIVRMSKGKSSGQQQKGWAVKNRNTDLRAKGDQVQRREHVEAAVRQGEPMVVLTVFRVLICWCKHIQTNNNDLLQRRCDPLYLCVGRTDGCASTTSWWR